MSRLRVEDRDTCNTVETGCLAPPAIAESHTKARCFRCGDSVCVNCSKRRSYLRYGVQRLCGRCIAELDR